jgi:hypothetical protein
VVFALSGGRLWVTTARSSVKARALEADLRVAGLVRDGDVAVAFRGRARTYDALDPLTWPAAAVRAPSLTRAAARFTLKNLRFFAGYAVDARQVPLSWTPPGRVFVRIDLDAGQVLMDGQVVDGWGDWGSRITSPATFGSLSRHRSIDLRAPAVVREAVGLPRSRGEGAVALEASPAGPLTVLPARWRRVATEGAFDVALTRDVAALAETGRPEVRTALTMDHADQWRASLMRGVLLQGSGAVFDPRAIRSGRRSLQERLRLMAGPSAEDSVLVRIRPSRVVWWQGWSSGAAGG